MLRRATSSLVRSGRLLPTTTRIIQARYQSTEQLQSFASVYEKGAPLDNVPDAPVPQAVKAIYHAPLRREAEYGVPVCDLQIRSFSIKNLEFFADFALRAAYYMKLPAFGPTPLPKRVERWTVPKSNFVHKKAQQNFERVTYSRLIQIKDGDPGVVQLWLAFLRKHEYHGLGMKANVWTFEKLGGGKRMAQRVEQSKKLAQQDKATLRTQVKSIKDAFKRSQNPPEQKKALKDSEGNIQQKEVRARDKKQPTGRLAELEGLARDSESLVRQLKNDVKKDASSKEKQRKFLTRLEHAEQRLNKSVGALEHMWIKMQSSDPVMQKISHVERSLILINWRLEGVAESFEAVLRQDWEAAEKNDLLEDIRNVDYRFARIKMKQRELQTEFTSRYGSEYSKKLQAQSSKEEQEEQEGFPGEHEKEEYEKRQREKSDPTEVEELKEKEQPSGEPGAGDKPQEVEESKVAQSTAEAGITMTIHSKSEASEGTPEDHMPREMEEAQEETKDFETSESESSSDHPEDQIPREMEEAQEESKPVEGGPLYSSGEIEVSKKLTETASGEPTIDIDVKAESADHAETEEIVHTQVPLNSENPRPEPTDSEDAVAADKADVNLSNPEPLDFRLAKDIQITATPREGDPTEVDATVSVKGQGVVAEGHAHIPRTPEPTESESNIAADSDLVPPPTQDSTKEDFRTAKEVQIDEAVKKDQ